MPVARDALLAAPPVVPACRAPTGRFAQSSAGRKPNLRGCTMPGTSRRRTVSEKDGIRILPSSGVDAPAKRYMSGEMSATEMVDLINAICPNRLDQPPNVQLFSCDISMAA